MTFFSMLMLSGVLIAATTLFLFLLMVQTGGDPKKLKAVPVRVPFAVVAGLCLLATGTQAVLTNQAAVREVESQRAYAAFVQIEGEATIGEAGDPGSNPFTDVSAGGNDWGDEGLHRALGSGEEIQLKTSSGKPAVLKLVGSGDGAFTPELTYDGEKVGWGTPVTVDAENTRGFPQFMKPADLPGS